MTGGAQRELVVELDPALEDELAGHLWALGCEGLWSEPAGAALRLHVFVEDGDPRLVERLCESLAGIEGARLLDDRPVPEQDWSATHRALAAPIEVGERFVVDPREPTLGSTPGPPGGRRLLRLPVRTAFGTGSHESTRLVVELLERCEVAGRLVLDVGAGTGVLSFAALHLGARGVVALDVDPAAALLLPQYMRLNDVRFRAFAGSLAALATDVPLFDLALVNVVPAEIDSDLPALAAVVRTGGMAILSGILAEAEADALARFAEVGFVERSRRGAGEWVAFVTERIG